MNPIDVHLDVGGIITVHAFDKVDEDGKYVTFEINLYNMNSLKVEFDLTAHDAMNLADAIKDCLGVEE